MLSCAAAMQPDHRVRVAEEDDDVGLELREHAVRAGAITEPTTSASVSPAAPELDVRRRQAELADEHVLEVVGVVLAGPDEGELEVAALCAAGG